MMRKLKPEWVEISGTDYRAAMTKVIGSYTYITCCEDKVTLIRYEGKPYIKIVWRNTNTVMPTVITYFKNTRWGKG